ncbi:unnamed protein product [Cercopithifilaria johnstoni]|uniref:Uncharacterized protein n=1 Tax=Cercopithifilaria johnstoni TaxID=2874296 RepID=A0A8J2LPQ3_9BILA|nr:unnamed protein product [Cercopithifilaria johnstoni]
MTKRWTKGRLSVGKQLRLGRRTTTTVVPIACLLEWDSAKCQIFHQRPLFAPNLAYSKTKYGLITPILPISGIVEEGAESKSSSISLLHTSETTLTATTATAKTLTSAKTTKAHLEHPENLATIAHLEPEYLPTVNGEFTKRTHTFLSTITTTTTAITTTTTPIITIATAHITTTTIIADTITLTTTITSTFSFIQKHNINHDIFPIPKIHSNRIMLTPALFHLFIDDDNDDNNDDDDDDDDDDENNNDDERFTFFWPTILPFQTQTAIIYSSEIRNIETTQSMIIPAKTKGSFHSLTKQNEYKPNENKYGKFFNSTFTMNKHFLPSIDRNNISQHEYNSYSNDYSGYYYHSDNIPEYNYSYLNSKHKHYRHPNTNYNHLQYLGNNSKCYDHPNNKSNYSNCMNATIISTFTASSQSHLSFASTAPSIIKSMQISSAISQQSNRNYFEDLWNDIAGPPPAVIINSDQKESRNKTTATISSSSIVTNIINSNLSTSPLIFNITHTLYPTHQTISLHKLHEKLTTPENDIDNKRLSSALPKIIKNNLLNISTKSSLVIDNAEEGKKRIKESEAQNLDNIPTQPKSQQVLTVPTVSSSTTTIKHRIRTTLGSHTIYAVRPTTPMGEFITDTVKTPATPTDFPRTALISIASLSVIIIIAIVVFCVFRCRQSGPSTDQYPMVCSSKQSGYAPIPAELSPPMMRETSRHNVGPLFHNRVNQLDGYQPIKGAVIPNGNNLMGIVKGNSASTSINGRKKEFKEWYV